MRIETPFLQLEFCDQSGALLRCRCGSTDVLSHSPATAFQLKFDGVDVPSEFVRQAHCHTENGLCIEQEYSVQAQNAYRAFQVWDVDEAGRLERVLFLQRQSDEQTDGPRELLQSATLCVSGLTAGSIEQTEISVPMARGLAGRPLSELLSRPRDLPLGGGKYPKDEHFGLPGAPDISPAVVCFENPAAPLHISVLPLSRECVVNSKIWGDGERLHLEQSFGCEIYPQASTRYELGRQVWLFQKASWPQALPTVGKLLAERGYGLAHNRSPWAKNATVLEADLSFFGGLKKLQSQLDELQDIGFNTIYLMPWHTGTYATRDYLQMNPEYGTLEDLRALCDAAHERGMKVLFDMLVNIAGEGSEYPQKHPDWFYHDAEGKPLRHPTWGGTCLDPASPGFRQFLIDYAVRCCTEWGADGFRVDAVAHRGGNLQPLPGLQPHQHSHAVFTLMAEIYDAIKQAKPDAILMAECFGPAQVPISDLVCTSWIAWLDWALDRVLHGKLNGAQVARLLHEQFAAMPPGTWFTGYTHTHDTVCFEGRDLQGPPIDTLFATMSLLCAGSMVFSGGWRMRQRPSDEEKPFYQRLFAMREKLGGVAGSDVQFEYGEDPALLIAKRPSNNGDVYVVANFSSQAQPLPHVAQVEYSYLGRESCDITPYDLVVYHA